jgi:hypothetical protein
MNWGVFWQRSAISSNRLPASYDRERALALARCRGPNPLPTALLAGRERTSIKKRKRIIAIPVSGSKSVKPLAA